MGWVDHITAGHPVSVSRAPRVRCLHVPSSPIRTIKEATRDILYINSGGLYKKFKVNRSST